MVSLLGRLRRAIQKVRLLMSFNMHGWRLASLIGAAPSMILRQISYGGSSNYSSSSASPSSSQRQLSFHGQPGLLDVTEDDCENGLLLSRTASDDVDRRAEQFIKNFYRHIQMERQVSLELGYCARESDYDA
ncbi:hypothetical protein QJS04_geneDACA003993 [Acorus gramineus]|uniref:Uncharacterized protein n=1 Tax=Acorus gramineus TaxID=55184 RepID=A0AAV9BFN3_ACOGR|nr:hypothetical protein QJS04_geneDACA003993 [Acorus gramineus]